jgi:hypothetical protein
MKMWTLGVVGAFAGLAFTVACSSSSNSCPSGVSINGVCQVVNGTGAGATSTSTGTGNHTTSTSTTATTSSGAGTGGTGGAPATGTGVGGAGDATCAKAGTQMACITCCQDADTTGANEWTTDLVNACACAAGSPCNADCTATGNDICTSSTASPTQACITCIDGLTSTDACISTFRTSCEMSTSCVSYNNCAAGCPQ